MKRTPLKPKKFYTLKKTPLKAKSSLLKKIHTSTSTKKRNIPIKITKEFIEEVIELYNQGKDSYWAISRELNCSPSTIKKILNSKGIITKTKDLQPLEINEVYGKFRVLSFDHSDFDRGRFYLVECVNCGKQFILQATYIKSNKIKCCEIERGYSKTKLFGIWMGMRQRCNDINHPAYVDYGGRGIKVCDEWNMDFKAFRTWAELNGYKNGLSIERIDVNKGYYPENCKWITMKQQAVNKRNNIKFFSENIGEYLQKHNWKKVRQYGLLLFSKLVKARASFKCELCGKPGTDAHHWYYTKAHNSITDIMSINGICLCRNCHMKAHDNITEYKEKIKKLRRFQAGPTILDKVVNLPIDFEHAREIILRGRKDLREIYKKNNFNKDSVVEELLKVNIKLDDTEAEKEE